MATPSSKYDVKSQITIGTGSTAITVNATDTYRNLYPRANTEFDSTILYTKTVAKDLLNVGVPEIQGDKHVDYMKTDGDGSTETWFASASGSTQYKVWDLVYNPYPKMGLDLGYTITYKTTNSYGRYYWGKNEVVETTIANANDLPIIRDWKYNELVFYFPIINVVRVSDVEDYINNFTPGKAQIYPQTTRVTLTELFNNPDKYYVESFTTGAWIWNPKTNRYVANNNFQIMANINTPNQSVGATGIQNVINLIKTQYFPYSGQSPYYVNLMFNAASTTQNAYGRNGFSDGIPKGLSTEYNYMLGYPSLEYKHVVNRGKIQRALDDIRDSASAATTVSEYYIEIEKMHEDEKCVMYSLPYVSGGTNADHSRQWLSTYQFKPVTFIKGSFFLKFIGSFGLYVTNDTSTYISTATPETLSTTTEVYLGEMNSKGFTTGRLIPWTELDNYEGYNKDGSSVNPDFDPEGGGGGGSDNDEESEYTGSAWLGNDSVKIDSGLSYRKMTSAQMTDFRGVIEVLKSYEMSYNQYMRNAIASGHIDDDTADKKWSKVFPTAADYTAFIYDKYGYGSDPVNSIISITAFPMDIPTSANLPIKDIGAVDLYIDIPWGYTTSGTVEFVRANYFTAGGPYGTVHSYPLVSSDAFRKTIAEHVIEHPSGYTDFRAYSPYTRLELYIPMHGTIDLDPAVVIGKTLTVKLSVTVADGSSIATVLINNRIYQTISGQVGYSIPLSTDASSLNNLALKTLSAQSQSQRLNAIGNIIHGLGSAIGSVATGNYGGAIGSTVDTVISGQQNAINSSAIKYQIEHATDGKIVVGQPSSLNAFMIHPKCQLIWHLPLMHGYDSEIYGKTVGYKCHKTTTLGSLTGYTECSNASLDNVSCTEAEKAIILEQLKNGIII